MKKTFKQKFKDYLLSGLNSTLQTIFLMFMGAFFFVLMLSNPQNDLHLGKFLGNIYQDAIYNTYAISGYNDNITKEIINTCYPFEIGDQPECIMHQFSFIYNYSDANHSINTPDTYVKVGGVCRDEAVFLAAVFRQMGWTVKYMYPTATHVYVHASHEYPCGVNEKCWIACEMNDMSYNCIHTNPNFPVEYIPKYYNDTIMVKNITYNGSERINGAIISSLLNDTVKI